MSKKDPEERPEETLEEKTARGLAELQAKEEEQKYSRYRSRFHAALRYGAQRGLLKSVAWSTVKVQTIGIENTKRLPDNFIVVANHSSHLDAPLILGTLPADKARVAAEEAVVTTGDALDLRVGLVGLEHVAAAHRPAGHRRHRSRRLP